MRPAEALSKAVYYLDRELAPSSKVRAFVRAGEIVTELGDDEVARRAEAGTLTELDGIGKSTAQVITDPAREDDLTATGSHITTKYLTVRAVAPHGEFQSYLKIPETDAETVINIVSKVVGTTCKVVGEVVCAWGAFCDAEEVCEDVVETFQEILGADVDTATPGTQALTNLINFNSDVTITSADDPQLWIQDTNGDGVYEVTRMENIDGATFTPAGGSPVALGLGSTISGTGGTIVGAKSRSAKPTTDKSRGIERPISCAAS